jgi:hypothetical protein
MIQLLKVGRRKARKNRGHNDAVGRIRSDHSATRRARDHRLEHRKSLVPSLREDET